MSIWNRNFEINKYELLKYIVNERIIKIKDNTKIAYNLNELSNETTLKGLYAKAMLEKLEQDNITRRRERNNWKSYRNRTWCVTVIINKIKETNNKEKGEEFFENK